MPDVQPGLVAVCGWDYQVDRVRDRLSHTISSPGLHITFSFRPSGNENIVLIW